MVEKAHLQVRLPQASHFLTFLFRADFCRRKIRMMSFSAR
jgi:hypothetical protein